VAATSSSVNKFRPFVALATSQWRHKAAANEGRMIAP
jgi:hypothetical protein